MEKHIKTYAIEDVLKILKQARATKGMTQRGLSERTGVPQSHLSKIESGLTDIRLSSLIELARALDLEVALVPRKAIPAIETVVRSTGYPAPVSSSADIAKRSRELEQALNTVKKLQLQFPEQPALKQLQENLQIISNFRSTGTEFAKLLAEALKAYRPLQQLATRQRIELGPLPAREITEAAKAIQKLRNASVHQPPAPNTPRPAYRLDEEEEGHD